MTRLALSIRNLHASVGDLAIVKGLDLDVPFGEVHAVMGPNGSGKSTLCHALSGKRGYEVEGSALVDGVDVLGLGVDERARAGLLQAFQYPTEIPGLELEVFMTEVAEAHALVGAGERMSSAATTFDMERFLARSVNDELSGGEKKRSEMFQMAVLEPKVALLDEIDSGLDIDAVKEVADAVAAMRTDDVGVVMITHYSRILKYVEPDRVHVMIDGRIADSGGPELADELEDGGYEAVRARLGIEAPSTPKPQSSVSDLFTDTPFDA